MLAQEGAVSQIQYVTLPKMIDLNSVVICDLCDLVRCVDPDYCILLIKDRHS